MTAHDLRALLAKAAAALPTPKRREFRQYLAEQAEPNTRHRKVHSWRKAKAQKRPRTKAPPRQPELPL